MNAKPEDRRTIFEEAVGIAATKEKKNENERKLAKARENIIRIIDITSELERDLGPKENAAEKTREFLQLSTEYKYHEVNNFLYKSDNSHAVKEKISNRIKGLEEEQAIRNSELQSTQEAYDAHQLESMQADERMRVLNNEILQLSVGVEKQSGFTTLFNQEINFLRGEITRLNNESVEKKEKIEALQNAIKAKQDYVQKSRSDENKTSNRIKEISTELASVMKRLTEGESMAQDAQNKVLKSVESLANINMNIGALAGEKNVITSQQSEVLEKMQALAQKRSEVASERDLCAMSAEKTAKEIVSLKSAIEDAESAIRSTNEYISELNNKIRAIEYEVSNLNTRTNV